MDCFIGEIRLFAGTFAPMDWAICDGHALNIQEAQELFALIGTTYGGDGQTTFNLPDLRGRVAVHQGTAPVPPGSANYVIGSTGGKETVALTLQQYPSHTHRLAAVAATSTANSDGTGKYIAGAAGDSPLVAKPMYLNSDVATPDTVTMATDSIKAAAGGSQPHENLQPYQCLNYIIALTGIWPQQE